MNNAPFGTKPYFIIAAILMAALILAACGGGSNSSTPPGVLPGSGSLIIQAQDAPLDNLVKFEITVVSIVLNPGSVQVLPQPVELELTSLQMTPELIRLANVPAGSYSSITVQFSEPEIKFCPATPPCDPVQEIEPPLQNVTVTVNQTFSVVADTTSGLLLDLDLAASVVTNAATGAIEGVDPVLTASIINITGDLDEFEAKGQVVSVSRTSSTAGTFVLEAFGNCQQVTITVDSTTEFEDFTPANSFENLAANQIVEVEADVRSAGTILADTVELEEGSVEDEAEGIITSVTRDAGGATSFKLVAHEVIPCSAAALANDIITVTVDANTQFRIDEDDLPVDTALFNDRRDLEVGQKVEVDPTGALGTSITAEKIKLQSQTIRGIVASTPTSSTIFEVVAASDLFPDPIITVRTSSVTEFDGVTGVGGLASGQDVRAKGLLFLNVGQLELVAEKVDATP